MRLEAAKPLLSRDDLDHQIKRLAQVVINVDSSVKYIGDAALALVVLESLQDDLAPTDAKVIHKDILERWARTLSRFLEHYEVAVPKDMRTSSEYINLKEDVMYEMRSRLIDTGDEYQDEQLQSKLLDLLEAEEVEIRKVMDRATR